MMKVEGLMPENCMMFDTPGVPHVHQLTTLLELDEVRRIRLPPPPPLPPYRPAPCSLPLFCPVLMPCACSAPPDTSTLCGSQSVPPPRVLPPPAHEEGCLLRAPGR